MYEELKIEIICLQSKDIVRTSPEDEWTDGNVDGDGWI